MGGHHQGNQHLGLAEGGNHREREVHVGHHSLTWDGYGPRSWPPLSQLLTPTAQPPAPLQISAAAIRALDLSPLDGWASLEPAARLQAGPQLELAIDWPRADDDPRELSEIPEVRLWSLRADARHPWLPLVLERQSGQLSRHVAMLLPHDFSRTEGLRFAPESLELWITHRLYLLDDWARSHGLNCRQNLGQMAAVLGLEVDDGFWESLA
jgi:hypothetical protein